MESLNKDVAALTGLSSKNLKDLVLKYELCISNRVREDTMENKSLTELDLGFGKLYIKHVDNLIQYKFIPDAKLEGMVTSAIKDPSFPLEKELEKALVNKITLLYKNLF